MIYLNDQYQKEFISKVIAIDDLWIVLEDTAFYPNSGGQMNDTGKFIHDENEFLVKDVRKIDGKIKHEVDKSGLNVGDEIRGYIDWDRRYAMMRYHTASHVLSGLIHNETGAMITGNQLGLDKSRIDFSLENFDRDQLSAYIKKSNDIIKKNIEVTSFYLDDDPSEYLKLAKGIPDVKNVRIVKIGDFDQQPDGGTHVHNTSEIGTIELVKCENKGKNNRRLYFTLC